VGLDEIVIAVEALWHRVIILEIRKTIFAGEPGHDVVVGRAGAARVHGVCE